MPGPGSGINTTPTGSRAKPAAIRATRSRLGRRGSAGSMRTLSRSDPLPARPSRTLQGAVGTKPAVTFVSCCVWHASAHSLCACSPLPPSAAAPSVPPLLPMRGRARRRTPGARAAPLCHVLPERPWMLLDAVVRPRASLAAAGPRATGRAQAAAGRALARSQRPERSARAREALAAHRNASATAIAPCSRVAAAAVRRPPASTPWW